MIHAPRSALLWRGVLAVVLGVVVIVWPSITVAAFVVLFAVYAFIAAGTDLTAAWHAERTLTTVASAVLALFSLTAGIVALLWPGATALVLTVVVALWALGTGAVEVAMTFARGERDAERAWWALGGVVSIALGVALILHPAIGALALASVFGVYSVVYGSFVLAAAARVRAAEARETRSRPRPDGQISEGFYSGR